MLICCRIRSKMSTKNSTKISNEQTQIKTFYKAFIRHQEFVSVTKQIYISRTSVNNIYVGIGFRYTIYTIFHNRLTLLITNIYKKFFFFCLFSNLFTRVSTLQHCGVDIT